MRAGLLDETVRAFTPWVQQLYLLRARGIQPTAFTEDLVRSISGEQATSEVDASITPLYCLLQQPEVVELLIAMTLSASKSLDDGLMDSILAERCRTIFPTILEVISAVDRLDYSFIEQQGSQISTDLEPFPISPRQECRPRFQRIVAAVRGVIERSGLSEDLARFAMTKQVRNTEPAASTTVAATGCVE